MENLTTTCNTFLSESEAIISLAQGDLFALFLDEKKRFKIWDPEGLKDLFALKFDNEENKVKIENSFIEKLVHEFIAYKTLRKDYKKQEESSEFQNDLFFFLEIISKKIETQKIDTFDKKNLLEKCEKLVGESHYCDFFNITAFLDTIKNCLESDNLTSISNKNFVQGRKKFHNKQNLLSGQTRKLRKIETKLIKSIDKVNNQDYNF
ncbi:MAG TPA: hypothetical protein PKD96_01610 [Candidatus Absconditabacterales bacterium]|nr:hypothetical protein [Candidatus Absconditabacterales bacterium]HMT26974.1 hypothetical protein [Candidatus Absconditabacterales bacterium]